MLKFHFLNVGRGDCTIIELQNSEDRVFGLIDCCRTPERKSPAKDKLKELGASRLEFVCVTHPDDDHYTGILDVLKEFQVDTFFSFPLGKYLSDKAEFKRFANMLLESAKHQDNDTIGAGVEELAGILIHAYRNYQTKKRWDEITGYYNLLGVPRFDGVKFYGIFPPAQVRGTLDSAMKAGCFGGKFASNDLSVGIAVEYAGRRVVLGSDAPGSNWSAYTAWQRRSGQQIRSEIAKVPHHGSKKDCNSDFIESVFGPPEASSNRIGIVSANGTSHPAKEAMKLLHDQQIKTFCTNFPAHFQNAPTKLITDTNKGAEFLSMLNLYAEPSNRVPQVCRGDITATIDHGGGITVKSEFSPLCPCADLFNQLAESA